MLAALDDAYDSPRDRLKALFGALTRQADQIARYGCPHGTLCLELDKRADAADLAARLMREPVDWAQRQFAALGCPDADALAIEVIARYQGAALLSSTFRDPALMTREAARVATWLDTLRPAPRKRPPSPCPARAGPCNAKDRRPRGGCPVASIGELARAPTASAAGSGVLGRVRHGQITRNGPKNMATAP